MKHFYTSFSVMLVSFSSFTQTTIYQEDFETNTNGTNYNTSISEFTDTGYDFFIRTDGSDIGSAYDISGINNSYYFAAQDIDGEGATLPVSFSTTPVNVSGMSSVEFSLLLAEDDDGTNQDWDNSDYVHITYSIDNGTSQNLLWIEGDESSGSASNSKPRIDTDFDNIGDGTEIISTFTKFSESITLSSNSTIQFFIEFSLNSGDEDLAIDDIQVINTSALSNKNNEITDLRVFPNPSSLGFVNITSKTAPKLNITVFNLLGKKVLDQDIKYHILDISSLNAGVYILKATQNHATSSKKLIIK